jgi:hypothetical protein
MYLNSTRWTSYYDIHGQVRETPMRVGDDFYGNSNGSKYVDKNGYRKDSIEQMYIPEYTIERSGEKLFELLKWFFINSGEWMNQFYEYDIVRSKRGFMTFIKYKLDSWGRCW